MENDFLNSLYNEEQVIYNKIINNPLFEELAEIQKFIVRRGGSPKCHFEGLIGKVDSITIGSIINSIDGDMLKFLGDKLQSSIINEFGYDQNWIWEKKGEFAFKKLGKCTPKELIDFVCMQEGVGETNKAGREKISANLYNVVSKLHKNDKIIKDDSDKSRGVQYELKHEASLNEAS